ncbi:hypothetical protein O6H91_23G049200 [Diphasiastrum complanatum]|uniref:Uncharacterized protein n=1 Tax=Diphasiastrum complanatum TaxID=34168 RepID=A0ACC2AAG4_DIPCM|nr:hypothetical protein O6H91_23G049200 [Diphasiastrum complanatum]
MGRSRGVLASSEDDAAWLGQRSKRRRFALGSESSDLGIAGIFEAKKALYHCNYCNKDISGMLRIKCAKCPDFDLCVECFSVGVEVTPHKSNHPYRVIDNLSFPLIHPDWNADEEILLLEGVEMYGLGNWAEVAEHVGTKTKAQCYEHYMTAFMNSPCSPLPDMSHISGKTKAELLAMAKTHSEGRKNFLSYTDGFGLRVVKREPSASPSRLKVEDMKDSFGDGRSPSGLSTGSKDTSKLLTTGSEVEGEDGEARTSAIGDSALPNARMTATKRASVGNQTKESSEIIKVGSNEPEGVSQITAAEPGQSNRSLGGKKPKPSTDESKAGISDGETSSYNPKREEFDPEYDNDAEAPLAEMEFKDNDTDADRELKLRMLHIYLSRIDERKRRRDFILERGLLNLKQQQAQDRKRSKEERELFQRSRIFLRYHSTEDHEALLAGLDAERKIRQRIEELQEYRAAGCHTLAEGEMYASEKRRRGTEASLRTSRESTSSLSNKAANRSNRYPNRDKAEGEPVSSGGLKEHQKIRSSVGNQLLASSIKLPALFSKGAKRALAPIDIRRLPGVELLSPTEQDLCSQTRLIPSHYLKMKETLMLESMKKGHVKLEDAVLMFKVDPSKTERVFELLSRMGWIQSDGPL